MAVAATGAVFDLIGAERERQEALHASGELRWIASDPNCPAGLRLAALVEEVGEVARAYHDGGDVSGELVQVAAVAVAWLESFTQERLAL